MSTAKKAKYSVFYRKLCISEHLLISILYAKPDSEYLPRGICSRLLFQIFGLKKDPFSTQSFVFSEKSPVKFDSLITATPDRESITWSSIVSNLWSKKGSLPIHTLKQTEIFISRRYPFSLLDH